MQEYWELYMKNLDGKPASILANVGISMELKEMQRIYPTVAYVKATLKDPNDKGLLAEEEDAEISYMEDKLEAATIKFRIGKYVGKVICDGAVNFVYYLQFTYNWQDMLDYALDEFGSYTIENAFTDDPEWHYYKNLLYPTPLEWQIIQNHKVCDALKAQGDKLHQKRAIEHKVFFPDASGKEAFIDAISAENFIYQEDVFNENGVEGVQFYRMDKPFYYDIDHLTMGLIAKAEQFGGLYDGWETSLVKF